jgi:hypothetical protein
VQVVAVDVQQQVGEHRLRARVEIADVVAVAGHHHQVGEIAQFARLAVGPYQGSDVLALVRARDGQDHRLRRIVEENAADPPRSAHSPRSCRADGIASDRYPAEPPASASAGSDHRGRTALRLRWLSMRSQFSRRQGLLLRLDATRHLVARFDQVTLEAGGQQATALDPPERMAGMDKRHTEQGGERLPT